MKILLSFNVYQLIKNAYRKQSSLFDFYCGNKKGSHPQWSLLKGKVKFVSPIPLIEQ